LSFDCVFFCFLLCPSRPTLFPYTTLFRSFGCIEVGSRGDTESLYQTLRDERFVVALREGKIRVAPHLLNSTQDIDRLLVVMAKRSEEHTSELQSPDHLVCRLLLEKKKTHK